jgi:DNA-binding MarR family transcriptional regulator
VDRRSVGQAHDKKASSATARRAAAGQAEAAVVAASTRWLDHDALARLAACRGPGEDDQDWAHATLMRLLDTDLQRETGLALADFDVLAQLAEAHGALRMTELADRALISRSGMSRRVARLVAEGLIRRDRAGTDGRGVVVALTEAGIARLAETAPVHARGISKLFVAQLDDQELALLERTLNKVIVDCSFG